MNTQQIFDTVARHLLTQNAKAQNAGECLYRAPDGKKCAAGCLIPDEVYHPDLEGNGINFLLNPEDSSWKYGHNSHVREPASKLQAALSLGDEERRLLSRLQTCHDDYDVAEWREQLARIGPNFGCNTDVLKEGA